MCVGLQGGELVVVDPALKEAAAAAGALTVVATTHGEVCALHKPGGVGISFSQARPQERSDAKALVVKATALGCISAWLAIASASRRSVLKLAPEDSLVELIL